MKLTATALALLVDGVAYAMILFLMSVGLTITLGVMRIANLAHCGFAMIGGYIGFMLVSQGRVSACFLALHRSAARRRWCWARRSSGPSIAGSTPPASWARS